jgi:Na+/melibiose symporter-like transporter
MAGPSVEQVGAGSQPHVPLGTKLLFGSGSVAEGVKNTAFNVFLLFYYNQVLGLPGTWTGAAIFLALCVDAVADPVIGSLSDGWRSRLGRRHPFMYAAPVPMALAFALLFRPPAGLADGALFAWLLVFAICVRVAMTLYMLPSNALVPELTPHYDERTSLVSYRFLFGWLGGLVASQLGYLHYFASAAGATDGLLEGGRYAGFGGACAILVGGSILVSAAGTHHLIPRLAQPSGEAPFSWTRFRTEVGEVLQSRSYRMLVGAALFAYVAAGFSDVVGLYVNKYFWELSQEQMALLVYGLVGAVLAGVAVARPLTERLDKKTAALALAGFAFSIAPLPIFLRLLGLFPENGDPWLLPLVTGHTVLLVASVVAIGITVSSMLADVADETELATGKRQEGMLSATISFTAKATSGLGGLVAGVALDLIDFPRGAAPGTVEPAKVAALGLAVGPGLMLLYLATLGFLARYGITRARHREIVDALARRRLGTGAEPAVRGPSGGSAPGAGL